MRTWTYSYKTPDGLRHEAEISAPSKDDAYAALRQNGIRAIRVTERIQPVIVRGVRKRHAAIAALVLSIAVGLAVWLLAPHDRPPPSPAAPAQTDEHAKPHRAVQPVTSIESEAIPFGIGNSIAKPRPRRQLSAPLDSMDLAAAFRHPSEIYLAAFAQPGLNLADLPSVTKAIATEDFDDDFYDAIEDPLLISTEDPKPIADLKRIVAGLKEEVSVMLGSGKTPSDVRMWLEERARMEAAYRTSILRGSDTRETKNAKLKAMGLAPAP